MKINQFRSMAAWMLAALLVAPSALAQDKPAPSVASAPPANTAQSSTPAANANVPVIRAETRLVLVDTVVTDKHGNYIRDLEQKDFRVWEDNKEQKVTAFSFGTEANTPNGQKHYLVLFFDNADMNFGDQAHARAAAAQFIDANMGPNQYMAIVNFGGVTQVAQNFTADAARLRQVVTGIKSSAVTGNPEIASLGAPSAFGGPSLGNAEYEFGQRTVLLALRDMAKNLAAIPGRKSLIFLTSGFPLDVIEMQSEVTAAIDACNKANVAIYPIDVRGLSTGMDLSPHSRLQLPNFGQQSSARIMPATLRYLPQDSSSKHLGAHLVYVYQRVSPGGAGGGGPRGGPVGGGAPRGGSPSGGAPRGGSPSGGAPRPGGNGGTRTGNGGGAARPAFNPYNAYNNPMNQPRQIIPPFPPSASTNQQVLYELADGTGGFVILNTNDLVGGLQKIAREQSEYYLLGYEPPDSQDGSCHTLKVKVDRGGTIVRSRSGYCKMKPVDLLAGKPIEKELESRANGTEAGVVASMEAPYFYTSENTARVNLAIDIPSNSIKFEKQKGKMKAEVNVLGIAYKPDGTVAAKFSDTADLEFDGKKEVEEFQKEPFEYQNQFEIAPGKYQLKVAFSSAGESFGKLESPLVIDAYDKKQFAMSALALSKQVIPVNQLSDGLDAELLADKTPLVAQGMQIVPSGDDRFTPKDHAAAYFEIYDPLLAGSTPPKVGVEVWVIDRKTKQQKLHVGITDTQKSIQAGSPVVPLGMRIPVEQLGPGSYELVLRAVDSAGNNSKERAATFEVQ